jgi:hypothetical protein
MVVSLGPGSVLQFHPFVGGTILPLMFRKIVQTRGISKLTYPFIDAFLTFFFSSADSLFLRKEFPRPWSCITKFDLLHIARTVIAF